MKSNGRKLCTSASVVLCIGIGVGSTAGAAESAANRELTEIVVTATRRETTLQTTSAALSVFTGADLAKRGVASVSDVVNGATGVDLVNAQPGTSQIIMRGVATSNTVNSNAESLQNATTATYLDEFVVGNTFLKTPDIQLVDMSRVEILKGPQGTLYGQSAMGGVVRYITNKPDPTRVEANATVTVGTVANGGDSYGGQGYVNVPVSEQFALRLVGYRRHDAGSIDSDVAQTEFFHTRFPRTAKKDADYVDTSGGRIAARWKPTEALTIDAGFFLNDINANARQWVTSTFAPTAAPTAPLPVPPNGLRPPNYSDPRAYAAQPLSVRNDGLNLRVSYDFPSFNASLMAARQTSEVEYWLEVSPSIDFFGASTPERNRSDAETRTLELRLVSNGAERSTIEWLAGAWYEDTDGYATVLNRWEAPTTVVFGLPLNNGDFPVDLGRFYKSSELAAYGELAINASDRLKFTVGYRRSHVEIDTGFDRATGKFDVYIGRSTLVGVPSKSDDDVNTYKAKVEYRLPGERALVFAQASSGYRAGGLNAGGLLVFPKPFKPDTLWNYELGAKTAWLDDRLIVNASVFYIDWKDIQLTTILDRQTFTSGIGNAGSATIKGFELETQFRPVPDLVLGANVGYTNAELAADYDPNGRGSPVARKGDPLPGSAEWRYSAFAEWRHELGNDTNVGARVFHYGVGERRGALGSRNALPLYTRTDVKFFADLARGITVTLFADNVANKRGETASIDNGSYVNNVYVTRPRTIGLSVSKDFR